MVKKKKVKQRVNTKGQHYHVGSGDKKKKVYRRLSPYDREQILSYRGENNPKALIEKIMPRSMLHKPKPTAKDLAKVKSSDSNLTAGKFFDTKPSAQPSYRNMYGKMGKHPDRAYVGLIWKFSADRNDRKELHNNWFLVTHVYQGGKKVDVVNVDNGKKMTLPFTDDTIKWLIADYTNDFGSIGEQRHKTEIKQFIEKHVGSGYAIADKDGNVIEPTGELITMRGDPRVSYKVSFKEQDKKKK